MVERVPGPTVVFGADDRAVEKAFIRMRRRVGRANEQLRSLGRLARVAFTGLSFGTALAVREFATFERSMIHVKNLMQASDADFKRLEATARKLGATTEHTATAAANGLRFFALAGYDVNSALMSLPHTLRLATVGELELGYATDLVTDTMTAFGAEASETERYVDAIGKASSISNQSVEQIGNAMTRAAPAARQMAIEVEEATAALGLLANAGLKGEKGGVHFRALTVALQDNARELEGLGIHVFDAAGEYRTLVDIVRDFENALEGMTAQQQTEIIDTLKNVRAKTALNNIVTQGSETLAGYTQEIIDSSGYVRRYSNELLDTLVGKFKTLISALTEAGLGFSEDIAPALIEFADKLTALITKFNELDTETRKTISSWIAFALRLSGMVLVSTVALRGINVIVGGLIFLRATVIAGRISWAAYWGAATVGLSILIPLLWELFKVIKNNWEPITEFMSYVWHSTTSKILNDIDTIRKDFNLLTASVLKGIAKIADATPGLNKVAATLRDLARAEELDAIVAQGRIDKRNDEWSKRIGANTLKGFDGSGGDGYDLEGGAPPQSPDAQAEAGGGGTPGTSTGTSGDPGGGPPGGLTPMQIMAQEQMDAERDKLWAHLDEMTRIKREADERDARNAEQAAKRKADAEDAQRDAARKRIEGVIKDRLSASKRGSKLLNAWQKVQILRDLALSVATRAPEAYMTTSAKYPWPLGQILGTLHAAAIVAMGSSAKSKAQGFNTGGVVPGIGNRDSVPAMLTPGEEVVRSPVVSALRQLLADGGIGGGGGGGTTTVIVKLYEDEIARAVARAGENR